MSRVEINMVDLQKLGFEFPIDAMSAALDHAGKDLAGAMQLLAPVDTGALRDSIDYIIRQYPQSGKVVLIAGPRSRYRAKNGNRPAKYAHLVEFGHVSVKPVKGASRRKGTAKGITFVAAHPFMRPAVEAFTVFAASPLASNIERSLTTTIAVMKGSHRKTISV